MTLRETRRPILARPRLIRPGETAFVTHGSLVAKRDEIALTLALITHRRLFGEVYSGLDPEYFRNMPQKSGVFICPFLQTKELIPDAVRPGDIDLVIIPYEEDDLILHKTLAVEIKAIRASFLKQGKSPNEFGFSQAMQIRALGFPYTAVGHLIVSDESPREAWREISVFQIIDEGGRVAPLPDRLHDMMPADLIGRAFGRMSKCCPIKDIGLAAAYVGSNTTLISQSYHENGIWLPFCRKAIRNEGASDELLERLASFLNANPRRFLDNPRFDPD